MDTISAGREDWHATIRKIPEEPQAIILEFSREQIRHHMLNVGDTNYELHDIEINQRAIVPGALILNTAAAGPVCALYPGKLFCGIESSRIRRPVWCSRGVVKVKFEELPEKSAEGFTRLRLVVQSLKGGNTHLEAVIFIQS